MASQDTEITLGTGKMLALFFGLVALNGAFFGMGYSLGKAGTHASLGAVERPATGPAIRPSGMKSGAQSANSQPDNGNLSFYKAVAAVTKQDDAQALVDALKKKQYTAFATNSSQTDKLYHVQVGPFGDVKEAEATKAKLVGDGYNPILKK